jgi:hypothetical protein
MDVALWVTHSEEIEKLLLPALKSMKPILPDAPGAVQSSSR